MGNSSPVSNSSTHMCQSFSEAFPGPVLNAPQNVSHTAQLSISGTNPAILSSLSSASISAVAMTRALIMDCSKLPVSSSRKRRQSPFMTSFAMDLRAGILTPYIFPSYGTIRELNSLYSGSDLSSRILSISPTLICIPFLW